MNAPLESYRVVSLAANLPGPVAAARLRDWGASVVKIEPPGGDPLAFLGADLYRRLTQGMDIRSLDLKNPAQRDELDSLLAEADLLLTANQPAALARLGLGWETLHPRFPDLCLVAIAGYPPPRDNDPGHDLTYQAEQGIITPGQMPRVLAADAAGAEQAVAAALALLLQRERTGAAGFKAVFLSEAAASLAETWRAGITTPDGLLGGALPNYSLYPTKAGTLAVAALEAHFCRRLLDALGMDTLERAALSAVFLTRTAAEWEAWARERNLPITAVAG